MKLSVDKGVFQNKRYKKALMLAAIMLGAFFLGRGVAYGRYITDTALNNMLSDDAEDSLADKTLKDVTSGSILESDNWGLGFGEEGSRPTGNATSDELAQYDAHYVNTTEEKVIYLTFDAGYENGNTAPILDALKKHNVPATFFVVGHYLESAPELIKRMVQEGHTVGNHTYNHPDMSEISDMESFQKEMNDVAVLYEEITGERMTMYYRPPQGKYSLGNLKMAKEMGYHTFFWSLAYVDWYQDKQPTKEEAFDKLLGRIHPGAIVLLHSTSSTNAQIMDELLTKWKEMGYTFRTLDDFVK